MMKAVQVTDDIFIVLTCLDEAVFVVLEWGFLVMWSSYNFLSVLHFEVSAEVVIRLRNQLVDYFSQSGYFRTP